MLTASNELFSIIIFRVEHSGSARAVYPASLRRGSMVLLQIQTGSFGEPPTPSAPHFGIRPVLDQTEALGSIGI